MIRRWAWLMLLAAVGGVACFHGIALKAIALAAYGAWVAFWTMILFVLPERE